MRIIIFLLCAVFTVSATPGADSSTTAVVDSSDVRLARFFAGVSLIRSAHGLTEAVQAARFRELEAASGVTAAEAADFLRGCRNDPERWRNINNLTIPILMTISENAAVKTPALPERKKRIWQGQ